MDSPRISGLSFFGGLPDKRFYLEDSFVSLDKSIIWRFNDLFWKHLDLWQKTYGEGFEDLQPDGISRTNRPDFVEPSARRFIDLLVRLEKENKLPEKIIVLEQGPGSGQYAKLFLIYISQNAPQFFDRLIYVLSDTSSEVLIKVLKKLKFLKEKVKTYHQKHLYDLPKKYKGQVLFSRHSNVFDQLPGRLVKVEGGETREVLVRAVVNEKYRDVILVIPTKSGASRIRSWTPACRQDRSQDDREKMLEKFILENPRLWKEFWQNVKLEEKIVEIKNDFPYKDFLSRVDARLSGVFEMAWSTGTIENINILMEMVDWGRDGYLELTGLTLAKPEQFKKDRRPKKYDGAVAVAVNGVMLEEFVRSKNRDITIEPIFGINQMVTIK